MKYQKLSIDLVKRVTAMVTAAAIFITPARVTFANPPNQERRGSEHAVERIKHIIVIYQENWSFDSLYGQFPGADGLANSFDAIPQLDVSATPAYSSLILLTPSPLTGFPLAIDPQFPSAGGELAVASNHNLA